MRTKYTLIVDEKGVGHVMRHGRPVQDGTIICNRPVQDNPDRMVLQFCNGCCGGFSREYGEGWLGYLNEWMVWARMQTLRGHHA